MVVQYIETQTILDLFEETVRMPGGWVAKWWWEQEGLDLEGARDTEAAVRGQGRRRYGEIGGYGAGNQRYGILSSNLNTIKEQSLVIIWPMFYDLDPTNQILSRCGNTEAGTKKS